MLKFLIGLLAGLVLAFLVAVIGVFALVRLGAVSYTHLTLPTNREV